MLVDYLRSTSFDEEEPYEGKIKKELSRDLDLEVKILKIMTFYARESRFYIFSYFPASFRATESWVLIRISFLEESFPSCEVSVIPFLSEGSNLVSPLYWEGKYQEILPSVKKALTRLKSKLVLEVLRGK